MGKHKVVDAIRTQLPYWQYLGGETVTLDGESADSLTIPSTATIVEIRARGGEVYFEINTVEANALSPGYIPEDQGEILGPLSNLNSIRVFSATASTVCHVLYFREV